MQQTKEPLFPLGQIVATPGALAALEKAGQQPHKFLSRHVHGEWGNVPAEVTCPGYNPKQPLAKDSNLASTAARYKVDSAKIATTVRLELSKTRSKSRTSKRAETGSKVKRKLKTAARAA